MQTAVAESKWAEFRRNIRNRWKRYRNDHFTKVNRARERSISILQKRYGYNREQAIYQLDKHYSRAWLG